MTDPCELQSQESQRLQPDRTPAEAPTPGEGTRQAWCTLTDAEREAIEYFAGFQWTIVKTHAAALRGLLERTDRT